MEQFHRNGGCGWARQRGRPCRIWKRWLHLRPQEPSMCAVQRRCGLVPMHTQAAAWPVGVLQGRSPAIVQGGISFSHEWTLPFSWCPPWCAKKSVNDILCTLEDQRWGWSRSKTESSRKQPALVGFHTVACAVPPALPFPSLCVWHQDSAASPVSPE